MALGGKHIKTHTPGITVSTSTTLASATVSILSEGHGWPHHLSPLKEVLVASRSSLEQCLAPRNGPKETPDTWLSQACPCPAQVGFFSVIAGSGSWLHRCRAEENPKAEEVSKEKSLGKLQFGKSMGIQSKLQHTKRMSILLVLFALLLQIPGKVARKRMQQLGSSWL